MIRHHQFSQCLILLAMLLFSFQSSLLLAQDYYDNGYYGDDSYEDDSTTYDEYGEEMTDSDSTYGGE